MGVRACDTWHKQDPGGQKRHRLSLTLSPVPFSPWTLAPFKGRSSGSLQRGPLAAAWCSPDSPARSEATPSSLVGSGHGPLRSAGRTGGRCVRMRAAQGTLGVPEWSAREGEKEQDGTLAPLPGRLGATETVHIGVYRSVGAPACRLSFLKPRTRSSSTLIACPCPAPGLAGSRCR